MFLCRCFGETLSTLQFARRAKLIKNKVGNDKNVKVRCSEETVVTSEVCSFIIFSGVPVHNVIKLVSSSGCYQRGCSRKHRYATGRDTQTEGSLDPISTGSSTCRTVRAHCDAYVLHCLLGGRIDSGSLFVCVVFSAQRT